MGIHAAHRRGGETFPWDRDIAEEEARASWCHAPPGRTFVAVEADGTIVGTAESEPNHGGPARTWPPRASWSTQNSTPWAGRALCAHVLEVARSDGYRAMQFNAVVETNFAAIALWRSFGFEVLATVPEAFHHPVAGYIGLHVMHRHL